MPVVKKSETSDQMIQQKIYDIFSKIPSESEQRAADEEGADGDVIVIGIDHGRSCDYVPERVRIGLNHGMLWYDTMYEHKCSYLNSLAVGSLEVYVRAMEEIVEDVLTCYEHPTYAELGYFVEIMLLDSCFIIELFHNRLTPYNNQNIKYCLQRDLILIGNQLPFLVLDKFFKTAQNQGKYRGEKLGDLTHNFFCNMVGPYGGITSCDNIQHLLELVYQTFFDPKSWCSPNVTKVTELEFIDYASELQEVGVKFNNIEGEKNFFEIKFQKGVLQIPRLRVSDRKLHLLRNLMAYEKQFPVHVPRRINDYAKFMQCLVRFRGSQLCNNEVILERVNQLGSEAEISLDFTYSHLLEDVKEHCRSPRKLWMADLWRNYCNSPWTFLSVVAALLLLSLTVTQTVFAILSYFHPPQPNK